MDDGPILHDRATRGEQLTQEEVQLLAAWYAELDRDESMALFCSEMPPELADDETAVAQLQQRINSALEGLVASTKYLQAVEKQNVLLRYEIDTLRDLGAE